MDNRYVGARSVLRAAGDYGHIDVDSVETQPDADRPDPGESHADYADRFQCFLFLLSGRSRAVLAVQQHSLYCAAMANNAYV